jgi:hypothetical protein
VAVLPDATWDQLRGLVEAAAAERGLAVDVERILRAFAATVRAFTRRRAEPGRPSTEALRRGHRRVARAALALENALAALGRAGRASLDPWGSADDFEAWLDRLARFRAQAVRVAGAPGRRGAPCDTATRKLVVELAWILSREGLEVSTYAEGLLAQVVREVGERVGRRMPGGEALRRFLLPAVRLSNSHARCGIVEVTPAPLGSVPSSSKGRVH